jgi:hypothetical protein
VRDLYALSTDYRDNPEASALFFAETQNKMLFAVTGKTAAEIIVSRADPKQPNMNLQCWSGSRVRKVDIFVAKNYLSSDEVDTLNRIVVMFLDYADLQAKDRKVLTMDGWRSNLGRFLTFNDRPLLTHNGSVSREQMQSITEKRYAEFDAARKEAERLAADAEDVKALEDVEKEIKKLPRGTKRKEVEG